MNIESVAMLEIQSIIFNSNRLSNNPNSSISRSQARLTSGGLGIGPATLYHKKFASAKETDNSKSMNQMKTGMKLRVHPLV